MEPTDLTIEILKSIRDEIRGLKIGQDETNARLESLERTTNDRFGRLEERLDRHERILEHHGEILVKLVESQGRHEQAIGQLVAEVHGLNARIDNVLTGPMGSQVREHDERLGSIESRLAALESRTDR